MRILTVLTLIGWLAIGQVPSSACADDVAVASVATQPLASNLRRLRTALDRLGYPLPPKVGESPEVALAGDDPVAIQQAIDPLVLAVVSINPEERVSVRRGPVAATIQQAGFQPMLLKILNHSTSTSSLRVSSPQAGPVYAGTAQLSMQRQQQMHLLERQNVDRSNERFLSLDVYREPPMTRQLSGLEVEYAIVLVASADAGRREAILQFDIGDGTADLEHRNALPVLFDIQPAIPVKLKIWENKSPAIARIEIRDEVRRVYPMQAKRLAPDFFFQKHIYRIDGETVLLPPGTYTAEFSRGPEYRIGQKEFTVSADGKNELRIELQRWFNAADYGFFSGDHHIHAAGCAHYTSPTEGVTPEDMFRQVQGEGLNVGCVLTWGPCFDHQRRFFGPEAQFFGTDDTLLKYDLEISGFGSQALGHVCLLNLKNQTYPGSKGTKTEGWPTWTTPVMRWTKEQGGYAGYAHSASGLAIEPENAGRRLMQRYDQNQDQRLSPDEVATALLPEPFQQINTDRDATLSLDELVMSHERAAEQLPNLAIPEMNGVGAMEICVSTVAGVCDFISAMDTRRIQEWNTWYHLLNCGFPLKVSGETDFPCMSSRRVGKGRVYVHLGRDAKLDFADWCQGMAEGRSYVSDGYAHLPRFSVDGVAPGYGQVELASAGNVRVGAEVAFAPETPKAVAHGTLQADAGRELTGDTVLLHAPRSEQRVGGGMRKVEVIVNGRVVSTHRIPADGQVHSIDAEIPIDESSWVAIRQFPQLHSNPVNVQIAGKPIRASSDSARWCVEMTKLLWQNRERNISESERPDAKAAFDHAIAVLQQIGDESVSGGVISH